MIEKTTEVITLFDFYQDLLTKKQREYFQYYYEDDLTFSEVAEKFDVSRNAVHDNLRRTVKTLYDYEEKLHLVEKYKKKQQLIQQFRETKDESILSELEEL